MAFTWTPYAAPAMQAMGKGPANNYDFFRPADSQMLSGAALGAYLGANGLGGSAEINRTTKYDGGLTREMLGNTTGFLDNQLKTGFGDLTNTLDQYAQYGGVFGDKNSPVYSPQSKNGYGSVWGNNNPFKFGGF